jgi:hypothetical protein
MRNKSLPTKFYPLFWDVDTKSFSPSAKSLFVIQRILNKGDAEGVSWVLRHFNKKMIKKTLTTLRDFSPKIGRFWQLFLNIPEKEVVCLQKPYQKMRASHWPF